MQDVKINSEQELYVILESKGFSCLGYDVVAERTKKMRAFAGWSEEAPAERGTLDAYYEYIEVREACKKYCLNLGVKCTILLEPRLVGLEGRRVRVSDTDGNVRYFTVGRSGGWMPVHIEIANSRSTGGPQVWLKNTDKIEPKKW